MPWFWGSKDDDEDDDDYDSEEYTDEEYSDEEDSDEEKAPAEDDEEQDDNSLVVSNDDGQQENGEPDNENPDMSSEEKKDEALDETDEKPTENGMDSGISLLDEDDHPPSAIDQVSSAEEEESSDSEAEEGPPILETKIQPPVQVETVGEDSSSDDSDDTPDSDDEGDENEEVTSFKDKQSLLLLAAEHDRVDILKAILTENDEDKQELMNSGIPPLHVAISFGSTNATQSLLRMGADPSIRPNVAELQKQQKEQEGQVEIKNTNRFEGVSAWELAFGNAAFEELEQEGGEGGKRWSLFNSEDGDGKTSNGQLTIIRPVSMQPSKREGIRHAFTAEALRCIGGDELDRLKQLLESGMPPDIDIGGKDLYGWTVEMGAMKCEELLRPTEAAKYEAEESHNDAENDSILQRARVFRPGDTSVGELQNRLDELESLAVALSSCLDNLAEEVSVCHGLLLVNGGASALASHVKSLKALQAQKEAELNEAQNEWGSSDRELVALAKAAGKVGQEVLQTTPANFESQDPSKKESGSDSNEQIPMDSENEESKRRELTGQIAASENKIRKLRVSIADLSEENARDLKEVERRGLSGGIDLVRSLREETRDLEFQISEARSNTTTCRAKIGLIRTRMRNLSPKGEKLPDRTKKSTAAISGSDEAQVKTTSERIENGLNEVTVKNPSEQTETGKSSSGLNEVQVKTTSEQIETGDSRAIAVRAPGKQGFFKIDLWQVLLRIIGFNRAADRRAIEAAQQRQEEPGMAHVMTV
eukprot:scaffold4335_cov119-Cylindrotheca_fusiformis.AAC.13